MEDFETLQNSVSFETGEPQMINFNITHSQKNSVGNYTKSTFSFPGTPKELYLNIISTNFNRGIYQLRQTKTTETRTSLDGSLTGGKDSLRQDYLSMKNNYLASLSKKNYLNEAIGEMKCMECAELLETHENTQKALEESIQFTNIVLKEVHRLANQGFC